MESDETKKTQRFILNLIGSNLEQIAIWKMCIEEKHSLDLAYNMLSYYRDWNHELENEYMKNSMYITMGYDEAVKFPERKEPPKF